MIYKLSEFQKNVQANSKKLGLIHLQNPAGRAIRTKLRNEQQTL